MVNRAGQYSIRINDQWRVCFRWLDGNASGVEIVKQRRAISPDTALRLARYFGGDAQSWLNLQTAYDLHLAQQNTQEAIDREIFPHVAA